MRMVVPGMNLRAIGAATNGHLDCLRYAHENGCEWSEITCRYAVRNGNLDYLYFASKNGNLNCLRYVIDNKCPGCDNYKTLLRKI